MSVDGSALIAVISQPQKFDHHRKDPVGMALASGADPSGMFLMSSEDEKLRNQPVLLRRTSDLQLLLNDPPPPPPTPPPPRRNKKQQRAQSTPRPVQDRGAMTAPLILSNSNTNSCSIVEKRLRAARMMYQTDDMMLFESTMPSQKSRNSPLGSFSAALRPNDPPDIAAEWSRHFHQAGTPSQKSQLHVVALVNEESDIEIPAPPAARLLASSPNSSSANTEHRLRNLALSPNHRSSNNSIASPLRATQSGSSFKAARRHSPTKSPANGFFSDPDKLPFRTETKPPERMTRRPQSISLSSGLKPAPKKSSPTKRSARTKTPDNKQPGYQASADSKNQRHSSRESPVPINAPVQKSSLRSAAVVPSKSPSKRLLQQPVKNKTTTPANDNKLRHILRPRTPERLRLWPDRKATTATIAVAASTDKQPSKKGFFRKLFAKKKDKVATTEDSVSSAGQSSKSVNDGSSSGEQEQMQKQVRLKRSSSSNSRTSVPKNEGVLPKTNSSNLPPSSISNSTQTTSRSGENDQVVEGKNIRTVDEERPELFFTHDDISTLTNPTMDASFGLGFSKSFGSSKNGRRRGEDPSVGSGTSSDPMGRYWSNHLVAGTKQNDATPMEEPSLTPVIDPFCDPFFAEPDCSSPSVRTSTVTPKHDNTSLPHVDVDFSDSAAYYPMGDSPVQSLALVDSRNDMKQTPVLQVHVASQVNDPAGDSPLPSSSRRSKVVAGHRIQDPSPRGYQTPVFLEHPIRDPMGESPLHNNGRGPSALLDGSPLAPDPPLYMQSIEYELELVSDGSSLTSYTNSVVTEKREEAARTTQHSTQNNTNERFPSSPSAQQRSRAPIPRSPVQQKESDASNKDTILSYTQNAVLPPSPSENFPQLLLSSENEKGDSPVAPTTPKTRNTSPKTSNKLSLKTITKPEQDGSEVGNMGMDQQQPVVVKSTQSSSHPGLMEKAQQGHSPSSQSPRTSTTSHEFTFVSPRGRSDHLPSSTTLQSISPSVKKASVSTASAAFASKNEKKRLTMSTAARVNARAVAYLHNLNGDPSPRSFWHDADSDSEAASPAKIGLLSNGVFLNCQQPVDRDHESKSSRLFTSYSKGKFKNRKLSAPPARDNDLLKMRFQSVIVQSSRTQTATAAIAKKTTFDISSYGNGSFKNRKLGATPVKAKLSQTEDVSHLNVYDGSANITSSRTKIAPADLTKRATSFADISEGFPEFMGSSVFPLTKSITPATKLQYGVEGNSDDLESSLFSAHTAKFKWRRRSAAALENSSPPPMSKAPLPMSKAENEAAKLSDLATDKLDVLNRNVTCSHAVVAKGFHLLREQREHDIATGQAHRVIPTQCPIVPAVKRSIESQADQLEIKDPIQRAGRRLLSKAAVPIQSTARRFLAQREAVDRMWGLLEIQSYVRRWRAEAYLLASVISAITIQAMLRGFQARRRYRAISESAVLIQRIVRGYLISAQTYDLVYRIVLIQSQARGWSTRFRIRRHLSKIAAEAQLKAAHKVQTWWRAHSARMLYQFLLVDTIIAQCAARRFLAKREVELMSQTRAAASATKIQAIWRGFQGYTDYVFCLVDIMLVQRTVRSWLAKKEVQERRVRQASFARNRAALMIQKEWRCYSAYTDYIFALADVIRIQRAFHSWSSRRKENARRIKAAAVKIQSVWRAHNVLTDYVDYRSATKIQKHWRRHHAYVHYIFTLAHIIIVQCTVRSHIAAKEVYSLRMERSAVTIQKHWRRRSARMIVLQEIARILLVQSVVRRFAARRAAHRLRLEAIAAIEAGAATKIQTAWRGFWKFSHYVILQYEAIRVQSIIRGKLFRRDFNLQLGCCIMIQATVRRFLVVKKLKDLNVQEVLRMERAQSMRESLASCRIQFWWRVVLACRKEKKAALVIERFFLMIKMEIEREIERRDRLKQSKRMQRCRRKREADDKLLERVWLNTVDSHNDVFSFTSDGGSDVFSFSPKAGSTPISRSRSAKDTYPCSPLSAIASSAKSDKSKYQQRERKSFGHRASSPPKHLVMRHEYESPQASSRPKSSTRSSCSAVTETSAVSPLRRAKALTRGSSRHADELTKNLSLEEAFLDAEISEAKDRTKSAEQYRQKFGVRSAPHRTAPIHVNHFFADDLESLEGSTVMGDSAARRSVVGISAGSGGGGESRSRSTRSVPSSCDRVESSPRTKKHSESTRSASSSHDRVESSPRTKKQSESTRSAPSSRDRVESSPRSKKQSETYRLSSRLSPKTQEASPRNSSTHSRPSPRHGKILIMNPYPDYPKKGTISRASIGELEYNGEEFGMI